jgi:PIN domain nuclease of toxin-antitoxin system
MNLLLLDTHTVIWLLEDSPKLGRKANRACDDALAVNELAVPSIAFYEVGRQIRRGRLEISTSVRDFRTNVLALGIREIALSAEAAIRASEIDNLTRDPIDRLIVATAIVEDAVLLTADGSLLDWPGRLHRQDAQR